MMYLFVFNDRWHFQVCFLPSQANAAMLSSYVLDSILAQTVRFPLDLYLYRLMPYKESKQYVRDYDKLVHVQQKHQQDVEAKLLQHILSTTPKGNPVAIIKEIDQFCKQNWMMHIGEEKGVILANAVKKAEPKFILQLGTYCGYSSLLMAANSHAIIHTVQPNKHFAEVARQLFKHAGLSSRVTIHNGTLHCVQELIKNHGQFDFVMMDHVKEIYLDDFKLMEKLGAIRQGTTVFADNVIFPGSPDYLQHMQHNAYYDSTLYHSYNAYSNTPDAVLVSRKLAE